MRRSESFTHVRSETASVSLSKDQPGITSGEVIEAGSNFDRVYTIAPSLCTYPRR